MKLVLVSGGLRMNPESDLLAGVFVRLKAHELRRKPSDASEFLRDTVSS